MTSGSARRIWTCPRPARTSVKEYMVGKGIDTSRIETRGAGPDNPIADNKTEKGRQQNRRIEFKLVTK